MGKDGPRQPGLRDAIYGWWKETAARDGFFEALRRFGLMLWEFIRDSTPSRRRQRYGDVDFDWDYRVETTSATVGWRDRLLGMFHSPYQPTDLAMFREMIGTLEIDFRQFTFIDIGSGKGRALLMAAEYPFRRIVGIELLPELHRVALQNVAKYKSELQRCQQIEAICGDARDFLFPPEPSVVYLFNPLPETGLRQLLGNLQRSLSETPRPVLVLYHNPLLEWILDEQDWLRKIQRTHQYSIFRSGLL
jgi:SAM-dependent methyltransferase